MRFITTRHDPSWSTSDTNQRYPSSSISACCDEARILLFAAFVTPAGPGLFQEGLRSQLLAGLQVYHFAGAQPLRFCSSDQLARRSLACQNPQGRNRLAKLPRRSFTTLANVLIALFILTFFFESYILPCYVTKRCADGLGSRVHRVFNCSGFRYNVQPPPSNIRYLLASGTIVQACHVSDKRMQWVYPVALIAAASGIKFEECYTISPLSLLGILLASIFAALSISLLTSDPSHLVTRGARPLTTHPT